MVNGSDGVNRITSACRRKRAFLKMYTAVSKYKPNGTEKNGFELTLTFDFAYVLKSWNLDNLQAGVMSVRDFLHS